MARKTSSSSRLLPALLVLGLLAGIGYAARDHLHIDQLRAWILPPPPPPPTTGAAKGKKHGKRHSTSGASLTGSTSGSSDGRPSMPSPKPCLDPPTGEGLPEEGVTGSRGLEADEVRGAMTKVVNYALPCFADAPTGTLTLSVTAGCDGRVSDIRIDDDGGYPSDVTGCVVEILRAAEFPAHDLPDGYTFTYPVRYSAP